MSKRTILTVAILCVILAIPLFTASADPPEIFTEALSDYWDIPCGDFYVRDAWTGEARFIVQDWDPPRGSIHYSTLDYFYRIDAAGNPVGEMYPSHIHWVSVVRHPKHGWMDVGANSIPSFRGPDWYSSMLAGYIGMRKGISLTRATTSGWIWIWSDFAPHLNNKQRVLEYMCYN